VTSKVLFVGDSHIHALKQALRRRSKEPAGETQFVAMRLSGTKNGQAIGDLNESDIEKLVEPMGPNDLVVSCIGGNQHQKLALVQHPRPFDVFLPGEENDKFSTDVRVLPYQQVLAILERGIKYGRDGQRLRRIKAAATCEVLHLMPPPPKEDVQHVLANPESAFALAGIHELGVSPAKLRMKFWKIQMQALANLTDEMGLALLPPPPAAVTAAGFLDRPYYADDATHGNSAYGALIIDQIIEFLIHSGRRS